MNRNYDIRAIEIHDTSVIWNPKKIQEIVNFMVKHEMNTLVFHENDIADKLVYPSLLYREHVQDKNNYHIFQQIYQEIYHKSPSPFVFIDEKNILVELMRYIVHIAKREGIRVFLQTKEIWFADLMYENRQLMKDGIMCPSEPYWWETYLPSKYEELFIAIPDLSGIVTSTGTRESRASLAHGKCKCDKCRQMNLQEWQKKILLAMHKTISNAGKQFVVRDFTYYADEQNGLQASMMDLPADITVSIKNTPQDFYPTFPNNALIGGVGERDQWIEYEVMGEYFGFGVMPSVTVEDIRKRIKFGLERGAKGFTARIDWEGLPNHSAFDTVNALNVYACAMLSKNPDTPAADIYSAYLSEYGLYADGLNSSQQDGCTQAVMKILGASWSVMSKTPFILDYVFNSNGKMPASLEHGRFLALEHHGLQKWFPERAKDHEMTPQNIRLILKEKDEALAEINALYELVCSGNPGLQNDFYDLLKAQFEMYRLYVEQFLVITRLYVLYYSFGLQGKKKAVLEALNELRLFENKLKNFKFPAFEYPASVLLSYEKLHYFRLDAEQAVAHME